MWQHDKRTDDYILILNCVRIIDKKLIRKRGWEAQALKKV
jgi:hypothetical protein